MFSPLKFGGVFGVFLMLRFTKHDDKSVLLALLFVGQLSLRGPFVKYGFCSPNLLLLRRSMAYQSGSCFRLMRFSSSSPSFARAEAVEPIWVGEKHEH